MRIERYEVASAVHRIVEFVDFIFYLLIFIFLLFVIILIQRNLEQVVPYSILTKYSYIHSGINIEIRLVSYNAKVHNDNNAGTSQRCVGNNS